MHTLTEYNSVIIILGAVLLVLFLSYRLIMRKHSPARVLRSLFMYFAKRQERVMEFRITEETARTTMRAFEIKTLHHRFYNVLMNGPEVVSATPIDSFSIPVKDCYLRGRIDPANLNRYDIIVRENEEEHV